ncbi:MAG: hypothetical protein ACRD26_10190 [Vicinamibacterales bacterium]
MELTGLLTDIRRLLRSPRETVAAAAMLAVGVGCGSTAYAIVEAALLRPLPYREPYRLVSVWDASGPVGYELVSAGDAVALAHVVSFAGVAKHAGLTQRLHSGADARTVRGARVSGTLFEVLGVAAARGRTLRPDDTGLADRLPVVISARLARTEDLEPGPCWRSSVANWTRFVAADGDAVPLPRFASVKYADDQDGVPFVAVMEGVSATEHLEDDLTIFLATLDGPPQLWMAAQHLRPLDQFTADVRGKVGKPIVQERRESVEVGDGIERPLNVYRPDHGRNSRVPHVRSHCTTRSCGTREPSVALANRRSSSATSSGSASRVAPSSAASSAINCETVMPRSVARA